MQAAAATQTQVCVNHRVARRDVNAKSTKAAFGNKNPIRTNRRASLAAPIKASPLDTGTGTDSVTSVTTSAQARETRKEGRPVYSPDSYQAGGLAGWPLHFSLTPYCCDVT
jgi:hypothetical protein